MAGIEGPVNEVMKIRALIFLRLDNFSDVCFAPGN